MNTLKVTLKQHTPLIHFQHDQDGATLRASEVKPKLDRFILSKLTPEKIAQGKRDGWIKEKNGKVWLDYKMRIESERKIDDLQLLVKTNRNGKYETFVDFNSEKGKGNKFPFLISDMGGKETKEELMNMCMHEKATLYIRSSIMELGVLADNIEKFFACCNFGQRQSKGFGSFTVMSFQIDNQPEHPVDWNSSKQRYFENGTWALCFNLDKEDDELNRQIMLFSVLDFYWRCLKSGINYTNKKGNEEGYTERYLKAYLWTYLNRPNQENGPYTWEKRKLKEEFPCLRKPSSNDIFTDNPNLPTFARGLMGCPVNYEYRFPVTRNGRSITESHTVTIENYVIDPIDDKDSKDLIERIASPIIFKPYVDGTTVSVYILFDDFLINRIGDIPERKRNFRFTCEGESTTIAISPDSINYKDLISKYNFFLVSNQNYLNSLWGKYVYNPSQRKKEWMSGVSIKKNSEGKVERRCYGELIKWRFIPRDFNWNNILQPKSSGEEENKKNNGKSKQNEWMNYYVEIKLIRSQQ